MSELRERIDHELRTRCPGESPRLISIIAEIAELLAVTMKIRRAGRYWDRRRFESFVSLTALLRRSLWFLDGKTIDQTIALEILFDAERATASILGHYLPPEGSA